MSNPYDVNLDELNQNESDVLNQKKWIGAAGNAMQGFANAPTSYELLYGKKVAKPDFAGGMDQVAKNIQDPWEKQKKTYEAYQQAKTAKLSDEQNDPNSETSKAHQDNLRQNFPQMASKLGDSLSKISAAQMPDFLKPTELKAKIDNTKAIADERYGAQADSRKASADAKLAAQDNKDGLELSSYINKGWTGRSGQAGLVQGKIISAEAAEQLIEQGRTQKNGLDARQIEELAQSTAKLLGGGASASARVDALVSHTMFGSAQSLKEWLSGNPQGAKQEEFVKRMAETVAREKALANNQKNQFIIEGLPARAGLKKRNPELYNSILSSKGIDDSMIDEKGRYKAPADSAQKAKTVTQNGHTYTLNEQTGEYE